jgi:hypothetical protein
MGGWQRTWAFFVGVVVEVDNLATLAGKDVS